MSISPPDTKRRRLESHYRFESSPLLKAVLNAREAAARIFAHLQSREQEHLASAIDAPTPRIYLDAMRIGKATFETTQLLPPDAPLTLIKQLDLRNSPHVAEVQLISLLNRLSDLEVLYLSSNQSYSSALFHTIAEKSSLRILDISLTGVTDPDLQLILRDGNQLEELSITSCEHLTEAAFEGAQCPLLRTLKAANCKSFQDAAIGKIVQKFPHLEVLNLGLLRLSAQGYAPIADLPRLKRLWLNRFNHTFVPILTHILQNCRELIELHIDNTGPSNEPPANGDAFLFLTAPLKLKILEGEFQGIQIPAIIESCPEIEEIRGEFRVSDEDLPSLAKCQKLRFLSMDHNGEITNDGLRRIIRNHPSLTGLSLPWCYRLSFSLREIQYLKELEFLNLSHSHLYDFDLLPILKNCKKIKTLHLGSTHLSPQVIPELAQECRHITYLSIGGKDLPADAIESLKKLATQTKILYTGRA